MLREELDPIKDRKIKKVKSRPVSELNPKKAMICTSVSLLHDIQLWSTGTQASFLVKCNTYPVMTRISEYSQISDISNHMPAVHCFTCGVVPQKLVVSIYNGRCGCPPQHTSRGHVGVRFRVNVLYTFPWHSWLELWDRRKEGVRCRQWNVAY